jgi:hypothetical protein
MANPSYNRWPTPVTTDGQPQLQPMANPSSSMDLLGMLRNKLEEAPPDQGAGGVAPAGPGLRAQASGPADA